ncbi:hypothetical protein SNE40_018952 [Patella caerulea]|uniref:Uncharacterized protein n=1 Tax=Patella caerulea TaxID=87958 RepID=A0AAN8P8T3_PATCE
MATVTFDSPRSSLDTYRSVRSKAKPKHTLFGTSLEAFTDGEREHIHNIDVNKYINTYTPYVSTDLSTRLQDYENQKMRVQQAAEEYKASQAKALNFRTTPPPSSDKHRKPNDSQTLMELMNPDPPRQTNKIKQHQYKIMGDVFSSNNNQEMGIIRERQPQDSPRYGRRSSAKNIGFDSDFLVHYNPAQVKNTNENCSNDTSLVAQEKPKSIVPLPANIRHSFGSRMCDELLSDVDKVSGTLERQRQDRAPRRRIQEEIPTLLETPLNEYHDLGHKTRLNLFPGLSRDNKISVTQTNFNDSVHLQRVPVTDKYRMQRDELSTWAESNVIRDRIKKAWDQSHGEKKG